MRFRDGVEDLDLDLDFLSSDMVMRTMGEKFEGKDFTSAGWGEEMHLMTLYVRVDMTSAISLVHSRRRLIANRKTYQIIMTFVRCIEIVCSSFVAGSGRRSSAVWVALA